MKRSLLILTSVVAALGVGALIVVTTYAAICNGVVPLGAIAPAVPEWCQAPLPAGIDTHVESANAWVDNFNHGQSHAGLNSSYARGKANGGAIDVLHFQHNNHWMADIQGDNGQYPTMGAAWMRPDRTFNLENGKLVIEFEFAGPIAGTRNAPGIGDTWPEFTLTSDPSPANLRQNGTYLYETFAGSWTFGCRMQQSKHPICALYEPQDGPPAFPYRRWEINQNGGDVISEINGGDHVGTGDAIDQAWKGCTSVQDPDTLCRNFHRIEITSTTIKFFINGVPGYSAVLKNNELGNVLNNPFYVYFGDFAYQIEQNVVVRFHWDHLAINPEALGSPTPTPTVTPTSTPPAQTTITFDDLAGQNQVLNGQYPSGLINWGANVWWLSAPWGPHATKSVSFNVNGASKTFSFVSPKVLDSIDAGGISPSTITLACSGNANKVQAIPANTLVTIATGWTTPCTTVTVGSSNGWDTNFDTLKVH